MQIALEEHGSPATMPTSGTYWRKKYASVGKRGARVFLSLSSFWMTSEVWLIFKKVGYSKPLLQNRLLMCRHIYYCQWQRRSSSPRTLSKRTSSVWIPHGFNAINLTAIDAFYNSYLLSWKNKVCDCESKGCHTCRHWLYKIPLSGLTVAGLRWRDWTRVYPAMQRIHCDAV